MYFFPFPVCMMKRCPHRLFPIFVQIYQLGSAHLLECWCCFSVGSAVINYLSCVTKGRSSRDILDIISHAVPSAEPKHIFQLYVPSLVLQRDFCLVQRTGTNSSAITNQDKCRADHSWLRTSAWLYSVQDRPWDISDRGPNCDFSCRFVILHLWDCLCLLGSLHLTEINPFVCVTQSHHCQGQGVLQRNKHDSLGTWKEEQLIQGQRKEKGD